MVQLNNHISNHSNDEVGRSNQENSTYTSSSVLFLDALESCKEVVPFESAVIKLEVFPSNYNENFSMFMMSPHSYLQVRETMEVVIKSGYLSQLREISNKNDSCELKLEQNWRCNSIDHHIESSHPNNINNNLMEYFSSTNSIFNLYLTHTLHFACASYLF